MWSFSKSGLNAHTGRIWGIAAGQDLDGIEKFPSQEGECGYSKDTYVILKYLDAPTHIRDSFAPLAVSEPPKLLIISFFFGWDTSHNCCRVIWYGGSWELTHYVPFDMPDMTFSMLANQLKVMKTLCYESGS